MDRKKALETLGLPDKASAEEINRRTQVLYKKFRQIEKDENGNTLSDVEDAYKLLSGIEFHDGKTEQEKERRKEHPNIIFKLLKVDEDKARNLIYYYKWPVLIGIAVIAIVIYTIVSIATKENPDLNVIIAGETYISESAVLEERIEKDVEGVTAAQVQNIILSENNDAQTDMAMQQKYVVEVAAGQNDVYILDEAQYKKLASQGGVRPIEEVMGDLSALGIKPSELDGLKVAVVAEEGEPPNQPELFGIDVSSSKILRESGVEGERLIAAFGYHGKFTGNAVNFVRALMK